MSGKIIFTNGNHSLSQREIFPTQRAHGTHLLGEVGSATKDFLGFGVAITPASCYLLSLMEPEARRTLLKQIYSREGIGLSVGRLCVGSSDYSAELYTYDEFEGDTELEHFSIERDEKYVIPMIKEILEINPDIYLFASPWSPPAWMKTGGCTCGGFMRREFLDCYADYIIKFIDAYAAHGIKISALTPQNETETDQDCRMPACIWHPEIEADFIKILRKKLDARGLDVKIWMYDHNFAATQRVIWSLDNCEGLKEACDGVAFHYYGGSIEKTAQVTKAHPEMELHFTEGGPRLTDNYSTDWCKWGLQIARAIKIGYRSFTGWNLLLDELGGPNIGPFIGICGGLVTRHGESGELSYSGQYKAFSHIAPFITPDCELRYITESEDTCGQWMGGFPNYEHPVEGFSIDSHDGRKAAVLINSNQNGVQTQIELGGTLWYVELQANSISTVIVE